MTVKFTSVIVALTLTSALCAGVAAAQEKAKAKAARPPVAKDKVPDLFAADLAKIEAALPASATAMPKKQHKLLVFWRCDGFFHGGGIAAGNKCLELLGKKTGAFTVAEETREWEALDAANLAKFDGLVFNNTTSLDPTPERKQAILDFINKGKAIIGIHAATDNFKKWPEGAKLMGGLFAGHPWGGGGTWAFKLDEPDHPLCRAFGGKGFKLQDEIYQFKDAYTRADRRVLITLDLSDPVTGAVKGGRPDNDYAVAWIKNVGKGRLFYCSLGHGMIPFQYAPVVQFYLDGIQWALGDLKADATPKK